MKKGLCVAGVMLLIFLVTGIAWAGEGLNAANAVGDAVGQNAGSDEGDVESGGDAQWTFIFYLAADNEQEAYANATIAQLETGTARVEKHPQILVLIDRFSSLGTDVFEVADGETIPLTSYEEQNTADGAVLEEFAAYALDLAIHDNVAFVMKSEGLSWRGIGRDNTHAVFNEEGTQLIPDQLMPTGVLAEALEVAQETTGKDINLLVLEGVADGIY